MVDYKDRLDEAMREAGVTTTTLAKHLGVSYQAVKKVLDGKSGAFTAKNNDEAAAFLGVTSHWLSSGKKPKRAGGAHLHLVEGERFPGGPSLAHQLSHLEYETVSPMSWEQLMSEDPKGALPKKFSFPMPDESMAPRVRQGAVIVMDSTLQAKVGDGVLVRDSSGTLHFRQYRAGRPGVWEAYAFNETYRALESDRDGLTVLAVKVALEDRGL